MRQSANKVWTRHASGVIGAVTRKGSAARQAFARNCSRLEMLSGVWSIQDFMLEPLATGHGVSAKIWTRHASGVIGAVTRKSSAVRQALARNCSVIR
jgi:hypothetical protein